MSIGGAVSGTRLAAQPWRERPGSCARSARNCDPYRRIARRPQSADAAAAAGLDPSLERRSLELKGKSLGIDFVSVRMRP